MSICRFVAVLTIIFSAVLVVKKNGANADDIGTNFFLKASKSIPRIGRRSMDLDNYFLKASKTIPRIGRRTSGDQYLENLPLTVDKKFYGDKHFLDTGNAWGSIDHKDYASAMLGDEPYNDSFDHFPDSFWQRVKRNTESEEPRHQAML